MLEQLLDGRYQIQDKLGEGAFGETYKAIDMKRPSKPVCVVKRLKSMHTNQLVRERFEQEAIVLERLGEHPQIPALLAHFMVEQELFIVQEFIDGHPLSQEITPGKRLSEPYAIKLMQDVLEILCFVHENKVIHRDIKPANVMRRAKDGKLILIDFGIVKELGSMLSTMSHETNSIVAGTQGYMPSEQAKGKPRPSSDLYALGMMAIEALTGIPPFHLPEDPDTGEILWRDRVQVSDRLADFLSQMVRDRYTQRYPSAIEALQALQAIQKTILIISPSTHPPLHSSTLPPTKSSLPVFAFEVVAVNDRGEISNRRRGQADYFRDDLGNGVVLEMVKIPGGSFRMGSPESELERYSNESPQHKVTVPSFFMGKFTITQAQYQAIVGSNPSRFQGEKRPVETVSWDEAIEFAKR